LSEPSDMDAVFDVERTFGIWMRFITSDCNVASASSFGLFTKMAHCKYHLTRQFKQEHKKDPTTDDAINWECRPKVKD